MSWLLVPLLKNAILVLPLALLALAAARWSRRPALAHLLWVLVLIKLVTPPIIDVPLGWRLDVETWLGLTAESTEQNQGLNTSLASTGKNGQLSSSYPRPSRRRTDGQVATAAHPATPAKESSWSALIPRGEKRLQLIALVWLGGSVLVAF